jgi:light-regulated signal transduction histidine kinase (bacteriophytochrome)
MISSQDSSQDSREGGDSRPQDLERDLRELANALSHDLRAPLRAIDGFSRALAEECQSSISPRGHEYLKWITDAAQGMARQIEALVSTARLSVADVRWQPVDVSNIAQQVAAVQNAAHPQHPVQANIASGLQVQGDVRLIGVVMETLMQNAWAFTSQAKPAQVTVGQELGDGGRPAFFVRDNGLGFAPNQAERLFQPFCRLHTADQAPVGLGMGLCKARRAVARMGGEIWAKSEPGQGATFFFTVGSPAPDPGGQSQT